MDLKRSFLVFGLFFISFLVWKTWELITDVRTNQVLYQNYNVDLEKSHNPNIISIKTDVFLIKVNLKGGDIEQVKLLKFRNKLNSSKPLIFLDTKKDFLYQTRSGLIGKDGLENWTIDKRPIYKTQHQNFILKENEKELKIPLIWTSRSGITYVKTFIVKSGSYDLQVKYTIYNKTNKNLEMSMYGGLRQTVVSPIDKNSKIESFSLQTFRGAAYSTDSNKYEKYHFDSILNKKKLNIVTHQGWIAMLQKYFVAAWIPDGTQINTFYTNKIDNNTAEIGFYSDKINIDPNSKVTFGSKLWIGPEIQDKMALLAPNLDLTVDYGWLWFLSQPFFKLLKFLYNIVGNWGLSIILITFIMRVAMYPLTKSQYKMMSKMKMLQPKIETIKRIHKENKQKINEEMLILYKNEKINPLGGCFPLLIQMPIFLALYYMLISSVELRHAPFIFWIKDLSDSDPYYVLPILMGFTMFFVQNMTSNNVSDPIQKRIMYIIPIIFTMFFLWFPSGLVLYYTISNLVTIIQQKFISN